MEKKNMFIMGGVLIGILVILLVVVWAITNLKPVKYSYDELEEKIKKATESYYHKNPSMLPSEDGTYSLAYSTLESNGFIDPLSEIVENGSSCNSHIIVIKSGPEYTYIPYLDCGEIYSTKELYKQVLYNNSVVTSGSGLYQTTNGEYYFRGKIDNNYVAFGSTQKRDENIDTIWKIISIKDNMVKLKAVNPIRTKTVWDNRYNSTERSYDGYNDFDLSVLSEYLKNLKKDNTILNESENAKLVSNKLCIGERTQEDTTTDGSTECSKLSADEYYYGTITPYEYIRASLDPECNTLGNQSCSNFNFLANLGQSDEWIITPSTKANNLAFVFRGSLFEEEKTKNKNSIYPVITLNKYAFFKSGTGTLEDPYRIK
ncbi:MAG: hypothetical protein PUA90_03245 [bacterium]|nr:hypothetical protein [bacterium]